MLFPTPFDHFHPTLELKSRVILRSCHMWMQKSFCSDLNDAKNGIAEPQVSVKLFYNRNNNRQKSVKTTTNNHQTETRRGIFLQENCTVSCPGCPLVPPGDKQWQILLFASIIRAQLYNCTIVQLHNCTIAQLYNCTIAQLHNCTMHDAHCHSKQVQLSLQRYNM